MPAHLGCSDNPPLALVVPAGAPRWVTPELIQHTLRVWQPYYDHPLIPADALAIIMGVSRIVEVLSGGDREAIRGLGPREQP
jgi:hypothetical protein